MKAEDVKVGMEVEAQVPSGRWLPAKVTVRRRSTGMFWAVVTYGDGIKAESLFHADQLRPLTEEKP